MRASGNCRPEQCAANLLKLTRGEVPFDRLKGIGSSVIDNPTQEASISLEADAEWVIETYEPRVNINQINVRALLEAGSVEPAHMIDADIIVKKEGV